MKRFISIVVSLAIVTSTVFIATAETEDRYDIKISDINPEKYFMLSDGRAVPVILDSNQLSTAVQYEDEPTLPTETLDLYSSTVDENQIVNPLARSNNVDYTSLVNFNTLVSPKLNSSVSEPRFSYNSFIDENISEYSGELTLNFEDLNLKGRNGLDLKIGRTYQSSAALMGTPIRMILPNYNSGYGIADYLVYDYSNYYNDRYNLGTGWSFDFPSVQITKELVPDYVGDMFHYDEYKELYYHTGSGEVYHVEFTDDETDSNLENYYKKDIVFSQNDTGYTSTQNVRSFYSMTLSDKTKQYFAEDGRLIGIVDRFGNTINFEHTSMPIANRIPGGNFTCDEGMWTLSNSRAATLNDDIGYKDTTSMEVFSDDRGDVTIISQPILVEPFTTYKFSTSFLSTYGGDDIQITFKEYDTVHSYNNISESYNIENLPVNSWYTYENEYRTTSSATRYVRMEIFVDNGSEELFIDDVSFDMPKPLISKITDSIGRTVEFQYDGNIYNGDKTGNIILTVKSPDGAQLKTMTYNKGTISFGTFFAAKYLENSDYWYLTCSDTEGSNGNTASHGCQNTVYYHYTGGTDGNGKFLDLYHNAGSLTYKDSDNSINKVLLGIVRYKNRTRNYNYEVIRKYMGENGYWDTLRVSSRYERFLNYSPVTQDAGYEGSINRVNYTYGGTYYDPQKNETISFNNEGGYPDYKFDETSNLNELWNCTKTSKNRETTTFSNAKIIKQKLEELPTGLIKEEEYTYDSTFKNQPTQIKSTLSENGTTKEYYVITDYDSLGNVLSTTKEITADIKSNPELLEKYKIYYQYSPHGFVTEKSYYQSVDGQLLTEENVYDSLGRLTKTITPLGDETEYIYGDNNYPGNVTLLKQKDVTNMHGFFSSEKNISYEYDNYGLFNTRITETSDGKTAVTNMGYEYLYGNLLYTTYPDGSNEQYAYKPNGNISEYLSPFVQNLNTGFRIYETTQYNTSMVVFINDTYMPVLEQVTVNQYILPEGSENAYLYASCNSYYDTAGNLIYKRVLDFPNATTNEEGEIVSTPIITSFNLFDNYDRLTLEIDPEFDETTYQYDSFDRIVKVTDKNNNTHNYAYDDLDFSTDYYLKDSSGSMSNHITENYDVYGNVISVSAYPNGINGTAITESFEYDLNGNIVKHTDGKGNITTYAYDKADRLSKTTLPDSTKAESFYSKSDSPTTQKIISSDGKEKFSRISVYDGRGNESLKFYNYNCKLIGNDSYEYDNKNRLTSFSEGGYSNTYFYDDSDNFVAKTNGTSVIAMGYGPFGVLRSISNDNKASDLYYGYDELGRLIAKEQLQYIPSQDIHIAFSTSYDHDKSGNVISAVMPSERTQSYTYTPDNKLKTITTDNKNITYDYYASGYIKSITYPNGMITSYTYDNLNRVTAMQTVKGSNVINSLSYAYDANSNVISETRNNVTTTYSYDNLDRLTTVVYNNGKIVSYEYDALGNRTKETTVTGNDTQIKEYIYNDRYQLTEIKTNGTTTDLYTYNERGAIKTHNGKTYSYDVWDKLSSVSENGTTHNYVYDTNGIRTQKDNTIYVVNENNNVIMEADANHNIISETVWGHQPLARKVNNAWYYYIYNAHGDVIGLVSDSGTVVNSYEYDAWGSIVSETEAIDNPLKYAGEYYDDELSMYYLRARYYDPSIGRFTSYDIEEGSISNPQDMNRYVYCRNNPIKYVDPTGESVVLTCVILGAVVGAVAGGTVGGLVSFDRYGEVKWQWITGGIVLGGVSGSLIGWGAGAVVAKLGTIGVATNIMNGGGAAFASFDQLKRFLGSPGTGNQWHHIVEQCQTYSNRAGFSVKWVQNTNNVVPISKEIHEKISSYYSSIQNFTNGLTVRNWLNSKSFIEQYEFGIKVLEMFGISVGK